MHPGLVATQAVRTWCRLALAAERGVEVPPVAAPEVDTVELLAAVARHRVVHLLDAHAATLGLPAEIAEPLAERRHADRYSGAIRLLEVRQVQQVLSAAGIRWLLVKGAALAVQTTGDPQSRGTGDIDLLVAPADVWAAQQALQDEGWRPRVPVPAAGSWARRHVMDVEYEIALDRPTSIVDLHWRLDPTHDGLPGFEDAWALRTTVDIGGTEVATLAPRHALTHACHHAAKDEWRWLRSLVDVHRLARLPAAWDGGPPGRVDLQSLQVTSACLGLPATVPPDVDRAVHHVPARVLRRAHAAQGRPVFRERSLPGTYGLGIARYRVTASPVPRDVVRTVAATLAPFASVADLDDPTGWTAVPRLVWRRTAWVLRRLGARLSGRPESSVFESGSRS